MCRHSYQPNGPVGDPIHLGSPCHVKLCLLCLIVDLFQKEHILQKALPGVKVLCVEGLCLWEG